MMLNKTYFNSGESYLTWKSWVKPLCC